MARALGLDRAISFDMGGTTTDVCLILDGEAQIASDRSLGGRPLRQPMVAVESIGAGGGSIARLDHGSLMVGPESAGAEPGPACYAKGGERPTVTDANLMLGYMDTDRVLGGDVRLDPAAAREAIAPLGAAMGMTAEAAALGVVKVANAAMLRALRRVTVERGVDGRTCTLLAFGGAGPMHAVALARAFSIDKVVVPAHSSMFSALGCVGAEMSYAQQRTLRVASDAWEGERVDRARRELRATLAAPLQAAGHAGGGLTVEEVASIRYRGQSYAIEIATPPSTIRRAWAAPSWSATGCSTASPRRSRGSWSRSACASRRPATARSVHPAAKTNEPPSPTKTLPCTFETGEAVPTPRYDRAGLGADCSALEGPVIVDDAWSTVVVPPGATLTADDAGHLHIATGAGAMSGSRGPDHPGGHPPRADGDGGGNVPRGHALCPLAAAARGGRSLVRAHRRRRPPHRPGPRHPHAHGGDELHRARVPEAGAQGAAGAGRRLVPEPAGGRRQPPAGREGDPARSSWTATIVAFAASLAHWADIGGAVPGSYVAGATDAWQEGLRIPPFRLFTAAGPDREKLDMICANVRGADEREGDILAQVAASRAAEERVHHICAEHGRRRCSPPSPRSTTGPRRRCGRRSRRSPTAHTRARTGSTTMPAAAGRSPSACG